MFTEISNDGTNSVWMGNSDPNGNVTPTTAFAVFLCGDTTVQAVWQWRAVSSAWI